MPAPCAVLSRFYSLDPDLARRLIAACRQAAQPRSAAEIEVVVDTLLGCFEREIHFGQAAAEGYEALLAAGTPGALAAYGAALRRDGRHGAGLGRVTATFLPAVLLTDEASLLRSYRRTVAVLRNKGAYLLTAPLEGLRWLLSKADRPSAAEYLALLQTVFDRQLSYNRCQYLGNLLPRHLMRMPISRRCGQLQQLARIAAVDLRLLEPFLEGLDRGLNLLTDQALASFTDQALERAPGQFERAVRFIALRSNRGRECCQALQTAVPLSGVLGGLNRYLQARIGRPPRLKPLTALPGITDEMLVDGPRVACDGAGIYLPEEIDRYPCRESNGQLFRVLAKFEAGLIEYGTFRFDLGRGHDLGLIASVEKRRFQGMVADDLSRFMDEFAHRRLAIDLFTIFEHARIRVRLQADYPGIVRQGLPVFQTEFADRQAKRASASLLDAAYAKLALDLPSERIVRAKWADQALVAQMEAAFIKAAPDRMPVEACAGLVTTFYRTVVNALAVGARPYRPLTTPFRMALPIDAHVKAFSKAAHQAAAIARRLATRGFKVYPADLRMRLHRNAGRLDQEDVCELVRLARETDRSDEQWSTEPPSPAPADWQAADPANAAATVEDPDDVESVVWQREWNHLIGDYLHDHVRVRDRRLPTASNGFYTSVLERHQGLVRRLKYAFELLRPEGLKLLRQWVEGDDFDYRALLDYALDRRAGIMPSDRLYIKRIKQRRDVAVLLLVDLSRSTSNIVAGSEASVLSVAKEAIVLFSQALEVVGDRYAIAGFSGTGRLGVDYFRIKSFGSALDAAVRGSIGQLRPQRSTRMGAAVRRSTQDLLAIEARVRLLIVIGDGFPNDLEYKQDYAIADTRQAIGEARAQRIYTHAITVNIPANPRLDDLYGPVHHTVISDVRELPDQLLRIYGTLTRG